METWNGAALVKTARARLQGKDSRRIAAIHAGVTALAALVITLLQYVLAEGIGKTGGLAGMGTQSVLQTAQTVLVWGNALMVPFWNLGFFHSSIRWAREETAQPRDLLEGFHRFGPALRLMITRGLVVLMTILLCANLSSTLFMMTPAAETVMALAESAGADYNAMMEAVSQMSAEESWMLLDSMKSVLWVWAGLSLVILLPVLYRLRLADYAVMDQPRTSAIVAMLTSIKLTRRRCLRLFLLDLRFWWYYLLQAICVLLCYADVLLPVLGVQLPLNSTVQYLLFYGLYLLAQFGVLVLFRPRVETTYAVAYDWLLQQMPEEKTEPVQPQNLPWDAQ